MANLKRFFVSLAAVSLVLINAAAAYAQTTPGQGLEISPPLVDVKTDPAKTVTFNIRVRNITKTTLVAQGEVNDFVAQGENGQAKLLLDPNQVSPYSFKDWVQEIAPLNLAPGEQKTATINMNVPSTASPGGHYGVIRFTGTAPELEGTGVALSASIGTLVLINVSGDVVQKAQIADFYTSQNGKKSSFFEKGPVSFTERIKNEGNSHFKPIGTIRVTGTFGNEVGVLTVNKNGGNVLPGSTRRFDQTLNKTSLFGHYTAEANIQYAGKNLNQSIGFWVIPYKTVAIFLGIVLVLIVVTRQLLKGYKKRILNQADHTKKNKK